MEKISIMKAEELPERVKKEIGCYSGLIEINVEKHSGAVQKMESLKKMTFSDRLRDIMDEEGLKGMDNIFEESNE
jgi:hypothetical protein